MARLIHHTIAEQDLQRSLEEKAHSQHLQPLADLQVQNLNEQILIEKTDRFIILVFLAIFFIVLALNRLCTHLQVLSILEDSLPRLSFPELEDAVVLVVCCALCFVFVQLLGVLCCAVEWLDRMVLDTGVRERSWRRVVFGFGVGVKRWVWVGEVVWRRVGGFVDGKGEGEGGIWIMLKVVAAMTRGVGV